VAPRTWRRTSRPLIAAAACALAAIAGVLATRRDESPVVERAYAAITPHHAVVHYLVTTKVVPVRPHTIAFMERRAEAWISGTRSRTMAWIHIHSAGGKVRTFETEAARNGSNVIAYESFGNTVFRGSVAPKACATLTSCGLQSIDPVATLRVLCRSGAVRYAGREALDGRTLDVLLGSGRGLAPGPMRVLLDPRTYLPVEIIQTFDSPSGRPFLVATTTIHAYERLPMTEATAAMLTMRTYPHARRLCRTDKAGRPGRVASLCRGPG
jgi:hypothetical protein